MMERWGREAVREAEMWVGKEEKVVSSPLKPWTKTRRRALRSSDILGVAWGLWGMDDLGYDNLEVVSLVKGFRGLPGEIVCELLDVWMLGKRLYERMNHSISKAL